MGDAYIGEIRIFAGDFAPQGWAFCDGQVLNVAQNQALYAVIGQTYPGGNGSTTFALPNLQGRAPMCAGQGENLTRRDLGRPGGNAAVALTPQNLPKHTHAVRCDSASGSSADPTNRVWASIPGGGMGLPGEPFYTSVQPNVNMSPNAVDAAGTSDAYGKSEAHNNMQAHLGIHYIICVQGLFPPRQ